MAPAKMRGKHNNLLREVGEAAGIVDEIKQMLTKTQIGDSYDPHTWHETEVRHSHQWPRCIHFRQAQSTPLTIENNMNDRFQYTCTGSLKGS